MEKRKARSEARSEEYYAKNNEPSFGQLKKDYDFFDEKGRFYWITQENNDTFQNKRWRQTPDSGRTVVNGYGEVTLYVKLQRGASWFTEDDYYRTFTIEGQYSKEFYDIRVSSQWKGLEKRRTGTIEVKGLSRELCDSLILLRLLRTK